MVRNDERRAKNSTHRATATAIVVVLGLAIGGLVSARVGAAGLVGSFDVGAAGPFHTATRCAPVVAVPADALAVVEVQSSGSEAVLSLRTRTTTAQPWQCHRPMSARVGRTGVRPLAQRVAGDGSTPGGVFPLGTMTVPTTGATFQFFGNGTNPGVLGGWHQVVTGDCWWVEPGTSAYNTLVVRTRAGCIGDSEYLPDYPNSYAAAALIGANMGPGRSGDEPGEVPRAGAIFLHAHSYDARGASRPTSGCVSLALGGLQYVLRRLPAQGTYFVII